MRRDVVLAFVIGLAGLAVLAVTGVLGFLDTWEAAPAYSWAYVWFFSLIAFQALAWAQAGFGAGLRVPAFRRSAAPRRRGCRGRSRASPWYRSASA